ncbi:MAG TPA: PadR family transcriptional regulator [Acidimicrobiales bacterium]|jgi:DNA-binding PadR family transcriptional regulator|nr:PadR family transcriptional regulator [Acidimicrobiales bacterium]
MSRVFGHGALRLYLLHLLDEEPKHGYEVIRALEDRFMGMYTPSAGTIYPRLAALEEDGLVEHDVVQGKKVYKLTAAGKDELDARREEIDAIVADAVQSARALAREIRDDVRAGVRDLRRELKDAIRDVRREERRVTREAGRAGRDIAREARDAARSTREAVRAEWVDARNGADRGELKDVFRALRDDLESFVTDVVAAARRHRLDAERVRLVREALLDAREAVIEALDGRTTGDRRN